MKRESFSPPGKDTSGTSYKDAPRTDASQNRESQEVAYKLASYLLIAKSDKKAAVIFSRTNTIEANSQKKTKKLALEYLRQKRRNDGSEEIVIPENDKEKITQIRQELTIVDHAYLKEKKDKFKRRDRAILLFKAKSARLNGLNKEEKIQMYREAGYSEDEILKITGKKLLLSAGLSTALTLVSNGITGAAIAREEMIPFIENIPNNYSSIAVGAALLTYIASYAYITEKDLKLTKKFGGSTNPYVTSVYMAGDRLVPERTRDWLARGLPVGTNAITHAIAMPAIIAGVTANQDKIIAGSLAGSAFNVALGIGCEIFLRKKSKPKNVS